jgi:hypothetical protein
VRHNRGALVAAFVLTATTTSAGATSSFQVIVHPSVQGTRISRTNLSALFMGRASRWGDKTQALPVDQSAKAPVRHAFTAAVIGLSMGELQMWWQRRVVAERVFPPPIKDSDQEVLGYVAAHPGRSVTSAPTPPSPRA